MRIPRDTRRPAARAVALGLGWFSIALGLAELLMTRRLARGLGMRSQEGVLRAYGVREIATGVGILLARRRAPWLWARVAGDALDIATLASRLDGRRRGSAALALGAVAGVTVVDIVAAQAMTADEKAPEEWVDYSDRSGFPRGTQAMRGAAARRAQAPGTVPGGRVSM
jgi:hypothetical protein